MRGSWRYLLPILLIAILGSGYVYKKWREEIREIERSELANARQEFTALQRGLDLLTQNFYNSWNDYLSKILYMAEENERDRDSLRQELLSRLTPVYRNLRLLGLTQLHLHTKEGRSFLRLNHHEVFGDNLSAFRPSLRKLRKDFLFLKGFEAGRFAEGLRYIYPLFYDGEFTGSYEWVWSSEALVREAKKNHKGLYGLFISTPYLRSTMDGEVRKRTYRLCTLCKGYSYRRNLYGIYKREIIPLLRELGHKKDICREMSMQKDHFLSFTSDGKNYIATFLFIRSISGAPYGVFVKIEPNDRIAQANDDALFELFTILGFLSLLFVVLYRIDREKRFMRTLLDSQSNLIMLTNGKRLFNANKAFFDFFGVKSIHEFIHKYQCICHYFLEVDGFLQKEQEGLDWLQYLIRHADRKHQVMMYDRRRDENCIFSVTIDRFEKSHLYVITFQDISDIEKERRTFRREALIDHLTGCYNKRAYEQYLRDRIRTLRTYHHSDVYLVMFDIDDFKRINDVYGHQRGDAVLRELADLVRSQIRKSDFFARWGGDEFMIIMEGINREEIYKIARHLHRTIEKHDFFLPKHITCSFGITRLREKDSVKSATDRVDSYLYEAKIAGKNRIVIEAEEENSADQK
ncbi:diguanylate cyclase [Nitratifractor sp.]